MEWEEQDDGVHTPENPYCSDLNCWCHTDVEYHDMATQPYTTEEEITEVYQFYGLVYSGGA